MIQLERYFRIYGEATKALRECRYENASYLFNLLLSFFEEDKESIKDYEHLIEVLKKNIEACDILNNNNI
ncbi:MULTISPECIES: hypothetical protein [Brachyspira]|uniref:Uncharacterized protein n=1 Tax=Brachyspira suanatina TaxID=381802 RepID=A0A0G4KAF7_9SPIR|nr:MULTISPECIES: hypothetical protein [Brachyspira]MCZ9920419.1 hypothetical protein [Brachyspira hyodysenteriae]MDA0024054.1 hypothetical protein [Brachyspira hyodysenteriae]CRF35390.1 hypothetical protein BRSU_2624 [Brachyspira suanatina]